MVLLILEPTTIISKIFPKARLAVHIHEDDLELDYPGTNGAGARCECRISPVGVRELQPASLGLLSQEPHPSSFDRRRLGRESGGDFDSA